MIGTGAMCDPYMHCEKQLEMTKKCLEIIDYYGFGFAVQTKSDGVLRDLELLKSVNEKAKCVVQMTLTTYEEELCRIVEPCVCTTKKRFETLQILKENGIPTVVWLSPLLPFINDTKENMEGVLDYCIKAGVQGVICFGMGLTLREGNREYFYKALDKYFPGMKEKYQRKYGFAYEITSENHSQLMGIFHETCRKNHIMSNVGQVFDYLHYFPENKGYEQLSLF